MKITELKMHNLEELRKNTPWKTPEKNTWNIGQTENARP